MIRIRGPGTFLRTFKTIQTFVGMGLPVGVLTTINRWNLPHLDTTRRLARDAGATQWRVQLAKPMGRLAEHVGHIDASTNDDFVLATDDLRELIPELARMARLAEVDKIRVQVGDSIGYYGPHDEVLRGRRWDGRPQCWRGCQAGLSAIGIEADGTVKGCLSLQARRGEVDPFAEGNVKDRPLAEIWRAPNAFAYNRQHTRAQLTGPCARCIHAERCRGGARCVSAAAIDSVTEDPYCWYLVSGEIDHKVEPPPMSARTARYIASMGALAAMTGCGGDPQSGDLSDVEPDGDAVLDTSDTSDTHDTGDTTDTDIDVPDVPDSLDTSDTSDTNETDTLDCSVVCCSCEYGMIPDDIWQACCKVCEDACCDCDYGVPPPPQCCP